MIKTFETGKEYFVNGGGIITINKRTNRYIWISGSYKDRFNWNNKQFMVDKNNWFNLGECIVFKNMKYKQISYFCFAGHEKEE